MKLDVAKLPYTKVQVLSEDINFDPEYTIVYDSELQREKRVLRPKFNNNEMAYTQTQYMGIKFNLLDIVKKNNFLAGDKITIHDLLYGLMLRSGNDAAVALAEYAGGDIESFAELMNKKAQELSLSNTHFETPHGLDSDNHYTTAYELALLSNYALNNKTFSQIVGTKDYTITINGNPKNTQRFLS